MPAAWPNALDVQPEGRCRFTVAPPRRFLFPAILLLLAEEPVHGYALLDGLNQLGLGRMDRPAVYRALADLEADGLVLSRDAPPLAGSTRHVHSLTRKGEQALESWMSVVAQERASLDLVLRRYWYANAQRVPQLDDESGPDESVAAPVAAGGGSSRWARFEVRPSSSTIVVEARSNVGPIAFRTTVLQGAVEVQLRDGFVVEEPAPQAHLDVQVSSLSSGNALYDNELLRRIDVRRYPTAALDLRSLTRIGDGNCYELLGEVTIHGVTRSLAGMVTATVIEARPDARPGSSAARGRLNIDGEHVLDVRSFDMAIPKTTLLKIYPDVRLRLSIEAYAA